MSLLELEHVVKRSRGGQGEGDLLRDVCLELHEGEMVAVWGYHRSARSTLMRVAAGIEAPDAGSVRFQGRDLNGIAGIAGGLAYCRPPLRGTASASVIEALVWTQLARGVPLGSARTQASAALEHAGVGHCAQRSPSELEGAEAVRLCIAAALVQRPVLLVIDEPTTNVDLLERDRILSLLRSVRDEGVTVLTCVDRGTGLFGADRALSLSGGELHGHLAPELAPVVQMPLRMRG